MVAVLKCSWLEAPNATESFFKGFVLLAVTSSAAGLKVACAFDTDVVTVGAFGLGLGVGLGAGFGVDFCDGLGLGFGFGFGLIAITGLVTGALTLVVDF
jgi:hypothetical protein